MFPVVRMGFWENRREWVLWVTSSMSDSSWGFEWPCQMSSSSFPAEIKEPGISHLGLGCRSEGEEMMPTLVFWPPRLPVSYGVSLSSEHTAGVQSPLRKELEEFLERKRGKSSFHCRGGQATTLWMAQKRPDLSIVTGFGTAFLLEPSLHFISDK